MTDHFARATLLYEQSRFDLAEQELRQALALEPEHARAHAMLGLCLASDSKYRSATEESQAATHLAPDDWFVHYAMAHVLLERNRLKEARAAVKEAVRLDPMNSSPWAVLALIEHGMKRWKASLAAAERGLQIDPEDTRCQNARSMALVQLGRRGEATAAIGATLADDPEDALTQANKGWSLLDAGDYRGAKEHFREALRLEPQMEWAQQGMVTALKARNPIYRLLLNYFLWMSKLSTGVQWGLIIGLYVLFRIVRSVARANPDLQPVLTPVIIAYVVFVASSWLADPLFNLLLRLDRFGRYVLSRDETWGANVVGGCLLGVVVCLLVGIVTGAGSAYLAALFAGLLVIPASAVFRCDEGWPRQVMALYAGGMTLLGIGIVVSKLADLPPPLGLLGIFVLATIASPWVANALMSATPRH